MLLPERHAPPLGAAVGRASAGALEHLPIARVVNLSRALERAKERGFWVVALDPESPVSLFDTPDALWASDLAIVLGGEGRGCVTASAASPTTAWRSRCGAGSPL